MPKSMFMKKIMFILFTFSTFTTFAQYTAVKIEDGVYINKEWKFNAPMIANIPVVFNYPLVVVGDSTYKIIDNMGDTTMPTYKLYVSHCITTQGSIGVLAITEYNDGVYYLSVSYGDVMRRYILQAKNVSIIMK
jgi:hypothetical protein